MKTALQRVFFKSVLGIGLFTTSGMFFGGCGAIMKPLVEAGFKALSKSSDEIVSGAAKGIGKNSDAFTKGLTKNSDSFYTSPSKGSWKEFSEQSSLTSRPLRTLGRTTVGDDQEEDYQNEIASLNKEISIKPSYSLYYSRGVIKAKTLNDFEGALYDLNLAIRMNSSKDNAYVVRGIVKSKLGDYQGSLSDYTKAININKNNHLGFYNRGAVKAKYFKKRKSACLDFGEASSLGYAPAKRIFNDLDCIDFQ